MCNDHCLLPSSNLTTAMGNVPLMICLLKMVKLSIAMLNYWRVCQTCQKAQLLVVEPWPRSFPTCHAIPWHHFLTCAKKEPIHS